MRNIRSFYGAILLGAITVLTGCSNQEADFEESCVKLFVSEGEATVERARLLCGCMYDSFEVGLEKDELKNVTTFFKDAKSGSELEGKFKNQFTPARMGAIEKMVSRCDA